MAAAPAAAAEARVKLTASATAAAVVTAAGEPINIDEYQAFAFNQPQLQLTNAFTNIPLLYTPAIALDSPLARVGIRPRVMIDVSSIDMSTTILGRKLSTPICLSLCNSDVTKIMNQVEAMKAYAMVADDTNSCGIVTASTLKELEYITAMSTNATYLFQISSYNHNLTQVLSCLSSHGIRAVVVPAKTPKKDIHEIKSLTKLPIIIRDVTSSDSAIAAIDNGAVGLLVSSDETSCSSPDSDQLVSVVHAVQTTNLKCEVYYEFDIRRGTDVFKAIGLGAEAVFVRNPLTWGLAHSGKAGVRSIVEILKRELELCMAIAGTPSSQVITKSNLFTRSSM